MHPSIEMENRGGSCLWIAVGRLCSEWSTATHTHDMTHEYRQSVRKTAPGGVFKVNTSYRVFTFSSIAAFVCLYLHTSISHLRAFEGSHGS